MALSCYFAALLLVSLLWNTATGQSIAEVENPVNEGDDFVFNCSSVGTIFYSVNGQFSGSLYDRVLPPVVGTNYRVYTFPNVTIQDEGTVFGCRAQSGGMQIDIGSVTLMINSPPNYTDVNDIFEVRAPNQFSLTLNLDQTPPVGSNFSWTRNGMPYTGDVNATSINIPMTSCSDSGNYSVTAGNPFGSDTLSFTLVVEDIVFAAGSNSSVTLSFYVGEDFTVNCSVIESCPSDPVITLSISGQANPMDITSNPRQTFTLQNSADYTCTANNSRVVTTFTYRVQVMSRPTSPTSGPSTSPTTSTTIPPIFDNIGVIIGAVVGSLIGLAILVLVIPLLICCCIFTGIGAAIGCACCQAAKNKKESKSADAV